MSFLRCIVVKRSLNFELMLTLYEDFTLELWMIKIGISQHWFFFWFVCFTDTQKFSCSVISN